MSHRRHKNLQLLAPLFAGLATWLFYLSLGAFPRGVYEFFAERGEYQHLSVFFFFLGLALLALRLQYFQTEKGSLALSMPATMVSPEEAAKLAGSVPPRWRDTLLGRRIVNLVKGFERGEDLGPLEDRLAQKDYERLEQSSALIGWVRGLPPVIGLVGTLNGLRGGIAEIATLSGGQDINELRQGLQSFAGHSSTAFDTTLMGIIAALLLTAILFFVRQREDKHLEAVNAIAEELARRFERPGKDLYSVQRFSRAAIDNFAQKVQDTMENLTARIDGLLTARAGVFEASLSETGNRVVERFGADTAETLGRLSGAFSTAITAEVERGSAQMFERVVKEHSRHLDVQERIEAEIRDSLQGMEGSLGRLAVQVNRPQKFNIQLTSEPDGAREHPGPNNHAAFRES